MPKIEISEPAFQYLQNLANPLVDTTQTVMDRIIGDHQAISGTKPTNSQMPILYYSTEAWPDVSFTAITLAKINGKIVSKKYWNHLLITIIIECKAKGIERETILSALQANTLEVAPNEKEKTYGYKFIPEVNISIQGLDAKRACQNIQSLSQAFSIPVEIQFRWQGNTKAQHPGKKGILSFP